MNLARELDPPRPALTELAALQTLSADPATAARLACEARARGFGRQIWVRSAPAQLAVSAAIVRADRVLDLSSATCPGDPVPADMSAGPATPPDLPWPDPATLHAGDRLVLRVEHDQLPAYCAWLLRAAAAPATWTLAPWCPTPGGLFRLHLIAAARLALPPTVRVEVRHDLIGVRLAQVALGFGADTLAGPQDAGRHLPLAGVPRPNETSEAALCELVRQAGLEPITTPRPAAERTTP